MIFGRKPVAVAAINLVPRRRSWGGANQWTSQVTRWLRYHGWKVRFDLREKPDVIVMTHTGLAAGTSFGADEVERLKARFSEVPCIHRINDNDIRKKTSEMDALLAKSSRVADHTVFVSGWLRDYHAARWFDAARPHSVITPGADPRFFHPVGARSWDGREPLRLVTHHWSDNWSKGFDVYRDIDRLMAGGMRGRVHLRIIGRWPADLTWQAAEVFGPASGGRLADLLRGCHGYVSASRHEPGAMHVAEGLQCGLPILYHRDSGGTVEQGRRYGLELGNDLAAGLEAFALGYAEFRERLLSDPPSGCRMAAEYHRLMERLIVHA